MEKSDGRLTYKAGAGDYGIAVDFEEYSDIVHRMANKLGKYEDLGTPEQFTLLKIMMDALKEE